MGEKWYKLKDSEVISKLKSNLRKRPYRGRS